MLMQSTRSTASANSRTASGSVSGLNAIPTCSSCSRAARIVARDVVDRLDVEGDAVAARRRNRREMLGGLVDHQVHVDLAAGGGSSARSTRARSGPS